jgi:hypothetical protein
MPKSPRKQGSPKKTQPSLLMGHINKSAEKKRKALALEEQVRGLVKQNKEMKLELIKRIEDCEENARQEWHNHVQLVEEVDVMREELDLLMAARK